MNRGFSTLEILIALAVLSLALSAVILIIFGNQSLAVDTQTNIEALGRAQAMLEEARAVSHNDWDSVRSSSVVGTLFTQQLSVSDVAEFMKSITVNVTWHAEGRTHDVELTTLVGDIQNANTQGACAESTSGNWSSLVVASVDLGATGSITGVDVKGKIAYVSADGNATLPDFFAVDVSVSPAQVLWSLDTGPGLNMVQVVGDYAYAASQSITGQLQVIHLPTRTVYKYKLPGSGSGDTANTLYYYNRRIYLGTPMSSIAEFHSIDVSDPMSPHEVGTRELNVGINDIYVSNGVAYVATPDAEELKILDVHDPSNISALGGYDAAGGSGNGKSIARVGSRLYLGRTVGNDELYSLDITDIYNGAVARGNVNSSVYGVALIGSLIFLATGDASRDLQIWQTTNNASQLSYLTGVDLPAKPMAIDCEGQVVYLTTEDSTRGLLIVTSTP